MRVLLLILLALLPAVAVAGLGRRLYRQGAFTAIAQRWRRGSRSLRVAVMLLLAVTIAYGSDKNVGGATNRLMQTVGQFAGSVATNVFSLAERATGCAATVRTGENFTLTKPDNAVVADRIAIRGAHDDGFWTQDGGLWIQTDGTAAGRACLPYRFDLNGTGTGATSTLNPHPSNLTVFAVAKGSYGFLPEPLWGECGTSRIWTAMTERGSRLVTWEGAMPLRLTDSPVTFQAEFLDGGDVIYRYNGIPTNGNAFVRYSVLDCDGEVIRSLTRSFKVAVEATISLSRLQVTFANWRTIEGVLASPHVSRKREYNIHAVLSGKTCHR